MQESIGSKIFDIINIIILLSVTLLCLLPLWNILMVSVSEKGAVDAGQVYLLPVGFNLLSYSQILDDTGFFRSFVVSTKRVALSIVVSIGCVLLTAYPLSKTDKQFPARKYFMWILVFCMLFNGGIIPWFLTMKNYHLIDNIWGLVLSGGLPIFYVILAMNFFRNLPTALEEAVYVDGGDPWRTLAYIYIPLSKPMIATVTLFTIVGHWNEFFQGLVLSTREKNYPLQTYIQQMVVPVNLSTLSVEQIEQYVKLTNQSLDAAKIFIAMIPIIIVYPFLQKYFVKGIFLGAVKE